MTCSITLWRWWRVLRSTWPSSLAPRCLWGLVGIPVGGHEREGFFVPPPLTHPELLQGCRHKKRWTQRRGYLNLAITERRFKFAFVREICGSMLLYTWRRYCITLLVRGWPLHHSPSPFRIINLVSAFSRAPAPWIARLVHKIYNPGEYTTLKYCRLQHWN